MTTTEQLNTALAGRYAIERRIGEGGMAVVYLARDLKHNRHVALKVLNPELGAVLGSERFMAEIEVTANLHHPNLLPLFDSGEAGGLLFYAMPFVEGETLRARLVRERQLGVDEAVRITTAVAQALDYAHRHHIIHRDLKPENILLHEGQPLVMDFGIALAVSKAGGARITQTGLSLGTPQYMSPEQATGDHVLDGRSDIYSLAAVLYEMLVGDPPHTGSTVQAVIAKVITEQPRGIRATRPAISEHVEAATLMALAKVPADRFATAAAFAAALNGSRAITLPGNATRSTVHGASTMSRRGVSLREAAAWLVALAAVATAAWISARPEPEQPLRKFSVELPDSVTASGSSIRTYYSVGVSTDGRLLAFVGNRRPRSKIYLRRVDETEAREIAGTDGGSRPVFSPDGRTLLFIGERSELFSIAVTRGTPKLLVDTASSMYWADDGSIYFTRRDRSVWAIRPEGGLPRVVATLDSALGEQLASVEVLPGSRRAYVAIRRTVTRSDVMSVSRSSIIALVDLHSGKIEDIGFDAGSVRYSPPGLLLFGNSANALSAVRVSRNGHPILGTELTVAQDLATAGARALDFAVSHEGTLIYRPGQATRASATSITLVARDGTRRVLRNDGQRYDEPIVSPDGRRAVVRVGGDRFDTGNLWVLDIGSGAFTPLTRGDGSFRPAWSRDGKRIFYMTGSPRTSAVHSRSWDLSGPDSVHLKKSDIADFAEGPPGGWSVIRTYGSRDLLLVPTDSVATAVPRPFIGGPANETDPALSPDGRFIAFTSDESGQQEVYVTAVPGPGARVPVSIGGGNSPRWSADGLRLYYRTPAGLGAATIVDRPELVVTRRDAALNGGLPEDVENNFDIMPNGGLLIIDGPVAQRSASSLRVITGWRSLFSRPATAGRP